MTRAVRRCSATLVGALILSSPLSAQLQPEDKDTIAALSARATTKVLAMRDSLAKANKTLQFGLSLGVRQITDLKDVNVRNVVISPIDTTLRVDKKDPTDVVLSGMVTVYPWKKQVDTTGRGTPSERVEYRCRWCWLGFVANINLASFNADNVATFNKSIEGGIGVAVRLTDDFGLAATYERVFSRRLRDFVVANEQIIVDGKPLTAITEDDNRFFIDDNLNALSFKFVYLF
jgi:hypothetical protein